MFFLVIDLTLEMAAHTSQPHPLPLLLQSRKLQGILGFVTAFQLWLENHEMLVFF